MEQFRIITDIREYIKSVGPFCARSSQKDKHPTLYLNDDEGKTYNSIREKDYDFSECKKYIKPHSQKGLSFSAHWQHLKDKYKLKKKHSKGNAVNVYWVLEACDLPAQMEFVQDQSDKQHYFLTVTQQMSVEQLKKNLLWVADRMAVIKEVQKIL